MLIVVMGEFEGGVGKTQTQAYHDININCCQTNKLTEPNVDTERD